MSRDESKLELEKRNLELKNEQLVVETRKLEHEAVEQSILAQRAEFYWRLEDDRLRVFRFNDEVNGHTVMHCIRFLNRQIAQDQTRSIEIVIDSPGGDVMSGIELYDHIMDLRARGAHITTTVMGQAASMGGILAQAGEVRRIGPNGYLMIHEVAAMSLGKLSQIRDREVFLDRLQTRLLGILATRSTLSVDEIRQLVVF